MMAALAVMTLTLPQQDSLVAQVERARELYARGRRAEAAPLFEAAYRAYAGGRRLTPAQLTAAGTAARYLSYTQPARARDALRAYDAAIRADSSLLEPRLALADLFLERYNVAEARATLESVMARAPNEPRALLGMVRVGLLEGTAGGAALIARALNAAPDFVAARVALAEMHFMGENYEGAAQEAERALATDPSSVEAIAVLAAVAFLADDTAGFERQVQRGLAVDPTGRGLFTTLATVSERNRRYADAVRFARRAVQLDPQSWRGHALLGINRLRLGDMAAGRASLETAFAGDPFDLWSKNTLDLLDTLSRYDSAASRHFAFVADRKEAALLFLYAVPLAEEAYERMAARYGVRPRTPVRVELFPNHADFAVRTLGVPGLGALGVSFGQVIAMDAPSARRQGQFEWGSTLWHEIAHVFHMTASGYRVPRWLTEGLAVLEERRARPGWGDRAGVPFLAAYRDGRLLPVSRLNDGFVRPAYPDQVAFSYYQASLVCEMLEESFGADAPLRMLRAYGAGRRTADVLREVTRMAPESLDARFDGWFRRRFAAPLAALASADTARASSLLNERREHGTTALLRQAAAREAAGDLAGAVASLEQAIYAWPYTIGVHERLADIAARMARFDLVVRERRAVVALDPPDRPEAWYRLAQAYLSANDRDNARRAVLRALELAPGFARAQDLLLEIAERRN
jgi:cellulose synthase operon protein C